MTPYVPYDELLPHAAAFVTNGGWTGLTTALHHGVPIVQAGSTEETGGSTSADRVTRNSSRTD